MTTFVGKGTDIARAIDNALLFCDPKAEYLPGIVHVEFSMTHVAFTACDDYATGRDYVGEPTPNLSQVAFTLTEENAEHICKWSRSARTAAVTLTRDDEDSLGLSIGAMDYSYCAEEPASAWDDILPLIEEALVDYALPATVAFNAARLARFGRVKGAKDAPVDIRFYPTDSGAPVALVKVGPTFRGELQGVRRQEALKALGEGGEACFWAGH